MNIIDKLSPSLKKAKSLMETDFCKICPEYADGYCDKMRDYASVKYIFHDNDDLWEKIVKSGKCPYNAERLIYGRTVN